MTSNTPSCLPRHSATTIKLQRLQHPLPQQSHLQATTTSQVTRKLRQPQVILLLQATLGRELHHLLPQKMRPLGQVPSNALHAAVIRLRHIYNF